MFGFRPPKIADVIKDQIYEVQRALVDNAGKVAKAEAAVTSAQAHQAYLESRMATLQAQRRSLGCITTEDAS
jgi:hypothetical protein